MNDSEDERTSASIDDNFEVTIKVKEQCRKKIWAEFFAQCRERELSCHTEDLITIGPVEPRIPYSMPSDLVQKWVDCHNIGTDPSEMTSLESENKKSTANGCLKKSFTKIQSNETANQDGISSGNETHSTNLFTSKSRDNKTSLLSQYRQRGSKKLYTVTDSPVELSSNASSVKKNNSVLSYNARRTLNLIDKVQKIKSKKKRVKDSGNHSLEQVKEVENKTPQGSPAFHHRSIRSNRDSRDARDLQCDIIACTSESNSQCSTIQIMKCTDLIDDSNSDKLSSRKPFSTRSSMSTISNLNLMLSDDNSSKKLTCLKPAELLDVGKHQSTPKRSQYTSSSKVSKRQELTCAESTKVTKQNSSNPRKSMGLNLNDKNSGLSFDDDIPTLLTPKKTQSKSFANGFSSSKNANGAETTCLSRKRMRTASGSEKPQPKKCMEKKASLDKKVYGAVEDKMPRQDESFPQCSNERMSINGAKGSKKSVSSTVSKKESLRGNESEQLKKLRRSIRIAASPAAVYPKATSPFISTESRGSPSDCGQQFHNEETENLGKRKYKKIKKRTSKSNVQSSEKNLIKDKESSAADPSQASSPYISTESRGSPSDCGQQFHNEELQNSGKRKYKEIEKRTSKSNEQSPEKNLIKNKESSAADPSQATSPFIFTESHGSSSDCRQKFHNEELQNSGKRKYKEIEKRTSKSNEQSPEKNLIKNKESSATTPSQATSPFNTEPHGSFPNFKQKLHEEEIQNSNKRKYRKMKKGTIESNEKSSEKNLVRDQLSSMKRKKENKNRKFCTCSSSDSEVDEFRLKHKIRKNHLVEVERFSKSSLQLFSESEDETTSLDLISVLQKNKTIRKSMILWSSTIQNQKI